MLQLILQMYIHVGEDFILYCCKVKFQQETGKKNTIGSIIFIEKINIDQRRLPVLLIS
jgi:hypothetical protein